MIGISVDATVYLWNTVIRLVLIYRVQCVNLSNFNSEYLPGIPIPSSLYSKWDCHVFA